jgi:serine/threonine protein kinase/tetratricopeptide (TPR) repeat protein
MQGTLLNGRQVHNFRLERLLGRGGFADVFLGKHVYLQTYAALKMLRVQLSEESVDTFLQEGRTIARLEHPHIVRVSDYSVEEGVPCLIMQYAPYGSLRKLHPQGSRLPLSLLLSYVKQIASALQYAHDSGVVHCDVKPENMLLGSYKTVLLSDFGLAVFQHQMQTRRHKQIAGTRTYMAPERWQGIPVPASDQYALATVVYEWLCGQPPFSGSARELAYQHQCVPPPSLIARVPGLGSVLEGVVLTALQKQPQQRFASISAFATALEQALLVQEPGMRVPGATPRPLFRQAHPLVGREQELAAILPIVEDAIASSLVGHAPVSTSRTTPLRSSGILLAGEAGIGKTRLAEEICRIVQQQGWSVAWSRCYEQGKSAPYQMWSELLRSLIEQGLWPQSTQEKHANFFRPLTALLPQLVDLLPPEAPGIPAEAGNVQQRLWDTLLALFVAISERAPLLIVLDDLHWTDQSSSELFGYLLRRVSGYPILFLATYRDHELSIEHPLQDLFNQLQRERLITMLHLPGLSPDQMGLLLEYVPVPLLQRIQRQASGNPLFAEELAHIALLEPHTSEIGEESVQAGTLPGTITAVFEQRLRRLSPACKRLLSRAAVLDGTFSLAVLALLESNTGAAVDEERLYTLLEEALRARVLSEEGNGLHVSYRFWHPLLAHHLYYELSAGRRQMLHRRVGTVLRQVYATAEREGAALIVHHLLQGGAEAREIVYYADLAGDRAYALSVYPEAERFYLLAIEQTQLMLTSAQREDREVYVQQAFLCERLGECARYQGRPEDARRHFLHALELRQTLYTAVGLNAEEAQLQALLLCEVGVSWYDVGDFARALSFYERAEQVLREHEVSGGPVWAQLCLHRSYVFWCEGAYEEAQHSALESLSLFEEARGSVQLAIPTPLTRLRRTLKGDITDCGRAYALLGGIICTSGGVVAAVEHLRAAMVIYEQQQCVREIGIASATLSDIHLRQAEYGQAQEALNRSRKSGETTGDDALLSVVCCNQGILALRLGRLAEAEELFKQAIALAEKIRDPGYVCLFCTYLARALQDQGRLEEAMEQVHRALSVSHALNSLPSVSSAFIAVARLRIAQVRTYPSFLLLERTLSVEMLRRLLRTRRTLERVLELGGIEIETRVEGYVLLSCVLLLLNQVREAEQVARHSFAEAQRYELVWLSLYARRVLALVAAQQKQFETAAVVLEQVATEFHERGMRLEYARTLVEVLRVSLQQRSSVELLPLQNARRIFLDCQAHLDLLEVDQLLNDYAASSPALVS